MYIYIFFIVQIHRVIEFIFPSARALKKNDQVNNVTYGFCPGTAVILAVQTSMSKAHASSTLSLVGILDKERLAGTRPPEPRAPPQAPSGLDAAARVSLPGAPHPSRVCSSKRQADSGGFALPNKKVWKGPNLPDL